jgi:hypothetical protein
LRSQRLARVARRRERSASRMSATVVALIDPHPRRRVRGRAR